jgi:hypothetical protein
MLKFDPENYPPKKPGDVEFTDMFVLIHRAVNPIVMGRLVASTLLENMNPEDQDVAPEILAHLIETYPERDCESRRIYSSLIGRYIPQGLFEVGIEKEIGQRLPKGVRV